MDARLPEVSLQDIETAARAAAAAAMVIALLQPPPFHLRAFCRECAVAISGKGCMRRPRLRRGRARRRRQSSGRSERGPPGGSKVRLHQPRD